jgi:hypothetical protein
VKIKLLTLNHTLLFLCASMYLGTGLSLILFSFPTADQLTVDNYYMQFVPQVTAATHFFTYMTMVMLACAAIMIWSEWKTRQRWVPIVVMLAILVVTGLTKWVIFPLNDEMAAHITDPARLPVVLGEWMNLNKVRVSIWCVQWACMMFWFYRWAVRGKEAS